MVHSIHLWPASTKRLAVPIVFLHGWGSDALIWQDLQPHCCGWSDVYVVSLDYVANSLDQLIDDLLLQLPEQFFLCGWSLGGMLAVHLAATAPHRCVGLLTLAANAKFVADETWPQGMAPAVFEQFVTGLHQDQHKTLKRFAVLQSRGDELAKEQLKWYSAQTAHVSENLITGLQLLSLIDNREHLPNVRCPALHCYGEYDPLVPAAVINDLQPLLSSHQQVREIKNAAHLLHHPIQRFLPIMDERLSLLIEGGSDAR